MLEFKEQVPETEGQEGTRSHFDLLLLLRINGTLPWGELGNLIEGNSERQQFPRHARQTNPTTIPLK